MDIKLLQTITALKNLISQSENDPLYTESPQGRLFLWSLKQADKRLIEVVEDVIDQETLGGEL